MHSLQEDISLCSQNFLNGRADKSHIFFRQNYDTKLSDFGLAKDGPTDDKSHVSTRVMGTYGYAAPEYLATGRLVIPLAGSSSAQLSC